MREIYTNTNWSSGEGMFASSRRAVLRLFGGGVAIAATSSRLMAQSQTEVQVKASEEEFFNAYDRTKRFTNGEMDKTPWIADKHGNFDLDNARDNKLARLKMTNNLLGKRTYIPMLVRLMLAREEQPGGPALGGAGMFTWQLQEPDPAEFPGLPEGSIVMRSMYTARYLDPDTMEPVDELRNPYNSTLMKLEDQLFVENFIIFPNGGSKFIEEPQFVNDDPDLEKLSHFKRWGDELVMFSGGTYSKPGKHQPRFTENMWRSKFDEVMDPDRGLIGVDYSFCGVNKAFEKPWMGYSENDEDLLLDLANGRKFHDIDDIPDFHKRVLLEKYPDRV